ncbi:hypothetical protein C0995_009487 [Termitomyces sp. Mi166|nr:hypothetical protein C0995_009487 [Termitomyces sp. Mi166\
MTTPPGDPAASSQPLPQQPPPPTPKPTTPPPKKGRQKKQKASPPASSPPPPRPPAVPYAPYIMNPYPHYPQPYPSQQSPPHPPQPPQYPYPVHYYAPGPYQYPQMMMYPHPPRNPAVPEAPQTAPSPASTLKRKRKSAPDGRKGDRSDDEATSGSDARIPPQQHSQGVADVKKRTKTDPPICQHCKQYGFECTFFLPITETRFRKKKIEEESAAAAAAADKDRLEPAKGAPAPHPEAQTSVYGPTSAAHLLHSQASISSRIYETYDARNNHTFEVSKNGDGLIAIRRPAVDETAQLTHTKPVDLRIERETIEPLINAYFTDVAPILPVITKAEFLATPNPAPILLYSMCLVAAARRQVPQMVFDSIRFAVNSIIKWDDVLSTASIANVQALLILCMSGDCHSQFVPNALSALWIRLGTAIRMAQDLGLHRAESVKQTVELRRRLWGACLISDRWQVDPVTSSLLTSLTYGHPFMIDVQDCDARLPSSGDPNELYMDELVRLSVILGRVLKTIYRCCSFVNISSFDTDDILSPSGLSFTTDDMLYALLSDMEAWKAGLPEQLKFRGPETPRTAVEQWSKLVALTGEAIDWLEANDYLYDVWLLVAYAATSCALVQYHTWARRKDDEAAAKLRKLRDTVRRWEGSISPDHMSARRKTAEIIALLYEATQGPHPTVMEAPPLNPTGGVTVKTPVSGLDYKKDPTRPGGGVFIATGQAAREGDFQGVPAGVVISSSESESNLGERGQALAVSPSSISATTALNDRDRASLLSTSSSFAPPLPNDTQQNSSSPTSSNVPPMHRGLSMSSAIRSTANNQQGIGTGSSASPIVNFTPLGRRSGSYSNVNPAMNMQAQPQSNVQLMNVLDGPQGQNTLHEFALADNEFLSGIPGSQWDTFFSRFTGGGAASTANAMGHNDVAPFQGQRPSS